VEWGETTAAQRKGGAALTGAQCLPSDASSSPRAARQRSRSRVPWSGDGGVIANGCKGRAGEAPKGPRERDTDGAGQQKAGLVANHQSNKKGAKEQAGAGAARMGVGLDAEKNAGFKG
jgi:hypothetical protein